MYKKRENITDKSTKNKNQTTNEVTFSFNVSQIKCYTKTQKYKRRRLKTHVDKWYIHFIHASERY